MIYKRTSESGHTVEWNPEDEVKAEHAMKEIVGVVGVEIDNETAAKVRERYEELLNQ